MPSPLNDNPLAPYDTILGLQEPDALRTQIRELLAFAKSAQLLDTVDPQAATSRSPASEILGQITLLLHSLDQAMDPDGASLMRIEWKQRRRGPKPRSREQIDTQRAIFDKAISDLRDGANYEATIAEVQARGRMSRSEAAEWVAHQKRTRARLLAQIDENRKAIYGK